MEMRLVAIVIVVPLLTAVGLGSAALEGRQGYRSILPEFVPIVNDDTPRFGIPLRQRLIFRSGRGAGVDP